MKAIFEKALFGAALTAVPGLALAHHGEGEELAARVVHATFDPWHLGVTLLVVAGLVVATRLAGRARKGE
ncbi:MAG: hypothetical protein V2I25_06850 [Woeseiaceae bacterium]|jgi:hypothetical protein|nr:hypothetical protein [Woeseiaceae bacterium]